MTSTILCRNQNNSAANASVITEDIFVSANDFEEVPMGIADDGIDFLLDILTDLSVNRGAYAIREAYSNAYDATLATGDMTKKIEIEIPDFRCDGSNVQAGGSIVDKLNKNYAGTAAIRYAIVRDHGIGMTAEDVKRYFTQYGGSKKRCDKSESIGSKGLGSKAPLACADMFIVETVRAGIKTTAIIERRDGRNFANIKSEATSEENGTTVKIPVVDEQVSLQMSECIYSISKYNLDANLWINGEKVECFFDGKASETGYVYLGEVPCGTDEYGNTVAFRMWEREDHFPFDAFESIDLNLAGVRYELNNKRFHWSYGDGMPEIIVAGEPGYLNFTPSRDQVKDDAAKKRFIEAIGTALKQFDFSYAIEQYVSSLSLIDLKHWLTRTWEYSETTIEFRDDGRAYFTGTPKHSYYHKDPIKAFSIPASLFVRDGIDCRCLFENAEYVGNSFKLASYMSERKRFAIASVSGGYRGIAFNPIRKTELADCFFDLEMFDFQSMFAYIAGADKPQRIFSKMVFITDMENRINEFATWEKSIREVYSAADSSVLYAAVPANWSGFNAVEQKALENGMPEYVIVDIDTAIVEAKKYRSAHRVVSSKAGKSLRNSRRVSNLVISEFAQPADDVELNAMFDTVAYFKEGATADLDDAAYVADTMFVFGRVTGQAKVAIARLAYALMQTGKLPKAERIVWGEDRFKSAEINDLSDAGATILFDVRKNIKNLAKSALKNIDGLTVCDKFNGAEYNPSFMVSASTFYADFDGMEDSRKSALMKENLSVENTYCRVQVSEMNNISNIVKNDAISETRLESALSTARMLAMRTSEATCHAISLAFSDDTEAGRDMANLEACIEEMNALFDVDNEAYELVRIPFKGMSAEIIAEGFTDYIVENLDCAKKETENKENAAA